MPNINGRWKVLVISAKEREGREERKSWQRDIMNFFLDPRETHGYRCLLTSYWGQGLVGARWEGKEVYLSEKYHTVVTCKWNCEFIIFGFSEEEILATAREIRLIAENVPVPAIKDLVDIRL